MAEPDENRDDWDGIDWIEEFEGVPPEDRHYSSKQAQAHLELPAENQYTDDWTLISDARKAAVGYQCAKCGIALRERKYLLHTHHVNQDKSDNHIGNLMVVCVLCHAEFPNHFLDPLPPGDLEYLMSLRRQIPKPME